MPKTLTQYRVFIGSPGGLERERRAFRDVLSEFNRAIAESDGVVFSPIGWEDTIGGQGRPQELINFELRECDYALFVLHDRWGSPTGNGKSSGTEEEWQLSCELYNSRRIRQISLAFKSVRRDKMGDPGIQLSNVLAFKKQISDSKTHLYKDFAKLDDFCTIVRANLASWLRDHRRNSSSTALESVPSVAADTGTRSAPPHLPTFAFWHKEGRKLLLDHPQNPQAAIYCAANAKNCAEDPIQELDAAQLSASAHAQLNKYAESLEILNDAIERWDAEAVPEVRRRVALSKLNSGISLRALGRTAESIDIFTGLLKELQFENALGVDDVVAGAFINRAISSGIVGDKESELRDYEAIISRYESHPSEEIARYCARAFFNKIVRYDEDTRYELEISEVERFETVFKDNSKPFLDTFLSRALVNKGLALGELGRRSEEVAVYDHLISRFQNTNDNDARHQVLKAYLFRGLTQNGLELIEEEIAGYKQAINFAKPDTDQELLETLAQIHLNLGLSLGQVSRHDEEISAYIEFEEKFGEIESVDTQKYLSDVMLHKGYAHLVTDKPLDGLRIFDDLIKRFGYETDEDFSINVARAYGAKADALMLAENAKEAHEAYLHTISKYANDSDPEIKKLVARCRRRAKAASKLLSLRPS